MNKTIDALKLAENTLRDIIRVYKFETGTPVTALAVIREALAEPDIEEMTLTQIASRHEPVKQEPVAVVVAMLDKCISIIGTEMIHCKQAGDKWFMCQRFIHAIQDMQYEFKRDYAAPVSPKREWVDLTDDELKAALEVHQVGLSVRIGRIAIAAFKEKNK